MRTIKLRHDEVLPCELSATELLDCVAQAVRLGLAAGRVEVEAAYEVLLEGRAELAAELLSRALFPDGSDIIRARVEAHRKQSIARAA